MGCSRRPLLSPGYYAWRPRALGPHGSARLADRGHYRHPCRLPRRLRVPARTSRTRPGVRQPRAPRCCGSAHVAGRPTRPTWQPHPPAESPAGGPTRVRDGRRPVAHVSETTVTDGASTPTADDTTPGHGRVHADGRREHPSHHRIGHAQRLGLGGRLHHTPSPSATPGPVACDSDNPKADEKPHSLAGLPSRVAGSGFRGLQTQRQQRRQPHLPARGSRRVRRPGRQAPPSLGFAISIGMSCTWYC